MWTKILNSFKRPLKILSHPIVMTMSLYQALIFGTTFSIYTNMQDIYGGDYRFDTEQVGLLFLGPGLGFLTAVWFLFLKLTLSTTLLGRSMAVADLSFDFLWRTLVRSSSQYPYSGKLRIP
jgi:predicted MFS family arabinose efflux permease